MRSSVATATTEAIGYIRGEAARVPGAAVEERMAGLRDALDDALWRPLTPALEIDGTPFSASVETAPEFKSIARIAWLLVSAT